MYELERRRHSPGNLGKISETWDSTYSQQCAKNNRSKWKLYANAIKIPLTVAELDKHQEQKGLREQKIQSTITLITSETNKNIQ